MTLSVISKDIADLPAELVPDDPPSADQPLPETPAAAAWISVIILIAVSTLSYLDKTLPLMLLDPIKRTFEVSDTQLALMTGMAFGVCNAVVTLPLSWVADRWDRARLATIGIAVWSGMTVWSGYAHSFNDLLIARAGLGVGEAILGASGIALIADLFRPPQRVRPLSLFGLGQPLGMALALIFGGAMQTLMPVSALRALGITDGWRAPFVLVGGFGLVMALLSLAVREPRRRKGQMFGSVPVQERDGGSMGALISYLRKSAFVIVPITAGITVFTMLANGYHAWEPTLYTRIFHFPPAVVGSMIGSVTLVCGLIGIPFGAWLAGTLGRRSGNESSVKVLILSVIIATPPAVIGPLLHSGWAAFVVARSSYIGMVLAVSVLPAVLVGLMPRLLRARLMSIYSLVTGLVGIGCGPMVYSLVTDHLFHDPMKLHMTMALVTAVLGLNVLGLLLIVDRNYARGIELANAT